AAIARSDRGVEIGLAALGVEDELGADAPSVEIVADEVDEREIRIPARRVETDEPVDHFGAGKRGARHGRTMANRRRARQGADGTARLMCVLRQAQDEGSSLWPGRCPTRSSSS